ncbi:MAG TPA: peptide deformylase [Candidatus Paceibacterota bacterium]|nr:peptide deformylase [Candidatus Paceibacterota bacterium]
MTRIVQDGDPVLRKKAEPVPETLFGTPELDRMLAEMAEALDAEKDGVALAAPQIAIPYRIFIARLDRALPPNEDGSEHAPELVVFINPEFTRSSKRRIEMDEGCLSVRGIYGKTRRHERATVRARRADGSSFERGGGGVLAQIYQHEIDHLDGILFIDHATDLIEIRQGEDARPAPSHE